MSRVAMRGGPSTSAPSDGSRTTTIRDSQPREEGDENGPNVSDGGEEVGRIRLQGGRSRPRVVWSEDVVDNEHMGKKSSKICCIYHRPKRFDESSSSDESSDESDSSCDGHDHSHASGSRRRHRHAHRPESPNNNGNADGGANLRSREGGETVVHEVESDSDERNAYERPPRRKKGKGVARNANEA